MACARVKCAVFQLSPAAFDVGAGPTVTRGEDVAAGAASPLEAEPVPAPAPPAAVLPTVTVVSRSSTATVTLSDTDTVRALRVAALQALGGHSVPPSAVRMSSRGSVEAARRVPDSANHDCFPNDSALCASEGITDGAVLRVSFPDSPSGSDYAPFLPSMFPSLIAAATPFR